MSRKDYTDRNIDLVDLAEKIIQWFRAKEFEIQHHKEGPDIVIQAMKKSKLRTALGGSRAYRIYISGDSNKFFTEVTTGEWVQNLAATGVGTLLTGGLSLIGSGIAAGWSKKIETDLVNFIDNEIIINNSSNKISTSKTRQCPYCAEDIKKKAKFCRFCKHDVEPLT